MLNVFYANFSQLGLKLLEFNVGISLYQILYTHDAKLQKIFTKFFVVMHRLKPVTYFILHALV